MKINGRSTDRFGYELHTGKEAYGDGLEWPGSGKGIRPPGSGVGASANRFVGCVQSHLPAKWNKVEAQLQALQLGNLDHYGNECALLYNVPDDDENIEVLIVGNYRADLEDAPSRNGLIAGTSRGRVIFVDTGQGAVEMPCQSIEAVEYEKKFWSSGNVTITGRGAHGYEIKNVASEAERFVDWVRNHLTALPP